MNESRFKLIKRGFSKMCPVCGKSFLYSKYIKLNSSCKICKTKLSDYKTDDGPAYCTIFLVGHIIIPLILLVERSSNPPELWIQLLIWPIITIALCLWLLPRLKGVFLAFQISVKDRST